MEKITTVLKNLKTRDKCEDYAVIEEKNLRKFDCIAGHTARNKNMYYLDDGTILKKVCYQTNDGKNNFFLMIEPTQNQYFEIPIFCINNFLF